MTNKYRVTALLDAPPKWDAVAVLDAVRWAIEDDESTQDATILDITVEPVEIKGRGRRLPAHYVEPDCDPTTGVCHYGKVD